MALAIENRRQLAHALEAGGQCGVALAQSWIAFEQEVHVGVRHALDAADHTSRELLVDQIALMVEFEQG